MSIIAFTLTERKPGPFPANRRCTHVDPTTGTRCITRLCQFDPGPECFVHTDQARPATLHEQRVSFQELMAA